MYYLGFSYTESYNVPVWVRKWFINRLKQELEQNKSTPPPKPAHLNTPESNFLTGKSRTSAPSRLRRFT